MKRITACAMTVVLCLFVLNSCGVITPDKAVSEASFRNFVPEIESTIKPLQRDMAIANYEASISGQEDDYARAAALQLELKTLYSDPETFNRLMAWRKNGKVQDPLLARQLEVLYYAFVENQLPATALEELVSRASEIEQQFNTHRAVIDGAEVSDNELNSILRTSIDSAELEQAWLASKAIGPAVSERIIELVKLRNQAATDLGFTNFQAMQLAVTEQDPVAIEALFDELDELTRDEYQQVKAEIDLFLGERYGLDPAELRPWHYQNPFFQEAPTIYPVDLDAYYADADLVELTDTFFAGIGLPVDDILARSDLYGKPGKYQHAFSEDVDREGDVRILCSIEPNAYWMNTMLHELGHGVYSKFNDPEVPWLLRDAAHAFTTEAMANFFGRLASSPDWMHDMGLIEPEERDRIRAAAAATLRLEQLVFSRWSQVMFRFEKSLYENPNQDLNALWWDLVERYQLMQRPEGRDEPDWAAKIHVALYPAYYHNYLMGELLASQLLNHIETTVLGAEPGAHPSLVAQTEVGDFLRQEVFMPGRTLTWNQMIEAATGEPLTARFYAKQFVGGE